ncbi:MAG: energy transducer TonB [Bryobacteraceae bacterium]
MPPMADAPKLATVALDTPALLALAPPKPMAPTDVFASIAAPPEANPKPAFAVATGVFQAPVLNEKVLPRTVAKTGAFDGERQIGGTRASAVKVAAAGFGDPESNENEAVGRPRAAVGRFADAGFGAVAAARSPVEMKPKVRAGGFDSRIPVLSALPKLRLAQVRSTEVEILFKPRPAYTEEARKLKIEGEVLVEVLFTASGEVKVLRVTRGLGHGLDEAAAQAAANIRFKPAERDGLPMDSTAVAHITFRLAY